MTTSATADPSARRSDLATLTGEFASAELRSGDVLAGRFRIEALLGIGGFGVVYRAHDLSLDIDVALKLLRPELARRPEAFERFRQELLLARQVSSVHVVRIHDIAEHAGRWFITMDLVVGESLEDRLGRAAPLPTDEALAIARGLLEGLAAAHARGVVHRDLKPANILIDAAGHALISDFGIARSIGASGMTQSGVLVGTPEYLSPEQARGEPVDGRSDLYAVGLMLYEMLCGERPFSGGTPAETVIQRIVAAPPALARSRPDLPHWLHAFTDRLLRTDPRQRFDTAQQAIVALDTRRVPRAPIRWRRLGIAVGAVVLLAAIAVVGWQRYAHTLAAARADAVVAVHRVAVLPLQTPAQAPELAALARAVEEHARAWLRSDAAHPAVPRRRVLDALARQTPGIDADALRRQLPDIATAMAATRILYGELQRDGSTLVLQLRWWPSTEAGSAGVRITGADAPALFAAYRAAAPGLFAAAALQPGAAPALADDTAATFGGALLASDGNDAGAASGALATLAQNDGANALLAAALLQAQDRAHEDLAAQATRDRAVAQFADDRSAGGRELAARALLDNGQADAALRVLDAALHDFPDDSALLLLDAQALVDSGDGARALGILQHATAVDAQDARAWFLLGRTAIQQGEAEAAVSNYLTRALVLNRLRGDRAAEAETANALGVGYERLGQLDAAAAQYAQAAAIRDKLGDNAGLAKSLRNLAIVQAVQGDATSADRTLERVKSLLETSNDRASLADLYNDRGVVAEEHGDYAAALGFYRQALALRQELNAQAQIAGSLNNVGFASYSLGDFDNALVFWQQALAQYRKVDDRSGVLRIDESIGLLDIARGHFAAARERLTAALAAAEDHQLAEEAAVAQTYLGQLALLEGRYNEAASAALRAGASFAGRADQRGAAEAALLQAAIALALGDGAGADKLLAALDEQGVSAEQHALLSLLRAQRAQLAGDRAAAARQLDSAGGLAAAQSSIGLRVRLERVRLSLAQGDAAGAARALQALRSETVRLAEVPVRLQWLELETATALRSGRGADAAAHYREALAILRTTGRFADAVVLHRLGARALAATPAEATAARAAADALEAQLAADAPEGARETLRQILRRREHDEAPAGDE